MLFKKNEQKNNALAHTAANNQKSGKKLIAILLLLLCAENFYAQGNWYKATDFAKKINAQMFYEAVSETLTFSKNNATAAISIGEPLVILNRARIEFSPAPMKQNGAFLINEKMADIIESFFTNDVENEPLFKIAAILIDPGHGGKDAGAIGSYTENGKSIPVYEKNVVLPVARQLADMLKKTFPDKKILMTRTGDTYPTLEQRVEMANNVKLAEDEAIIFISIHANASFNKKATGFEVWYLPRDYKRYDLANGKDVEKEIKPIVNSMLEEEFSLESILMAKNILESLKDAVGDVSPSRGLKEKEYFVVRNAKMPSVLIELGFVTNEAEAKILSSPEYLNKYATGIYNGIIQFVSQFENHGF